MNLTEITCDLFYKCISEFNKKENKEKIENDFLNPLIDYIFQRLYPYFIITSIIFFLTFLLAVAIFYMVFKSSVRTL